MMTFLSRCSTTLATLFLVQLLLSPAPISATTDTLVLDIEGNPVESTSQYYIIPATIGFTGGLRVKLRPDQNQSPFTCPKFVYRTPREVDFGLPVKFIPTDLDQKNITLSTDLKIGFVSLEPDHLHCPAVWSLTTDPETDRIYVSTGVYVDRNWEVKQGTMLNALFKIVATGVTRPHVHIITYSPDQSQLILGDLALIYEDGTSWLGLSFNAPPKALPVYFIKKSD